MTVDFRLDGRRALVAGGSSGIGLAAAQALAEAGARVTVAARRQESVDEAVSALGGDAEGLALDIADIEASAAFVAERGPYDILVNSAGTARHTPALDTAAEDFDAVMGINLRGAYFLAQAVARGLRAADKGGSLITISSQMGLVGGHERAVYCASKHAVEGFTKAMAVEWGGHGIRVNTVCPTFTRTPMTEPTYQNPERVAWIDRMLALPRHANVEDIAGAVLYLASDASAMVTGSALRVDGGWTAH